MSAPKILFVLTARGGSKGVPGKNIAKLGAHPLLAYRILSSKKIKFQHEILLSTDSPEIVEVAKKYGVNAPMMRSPEYATDEAKCEDAVYEMAKFASQKQEFDYVCMLQPTSPFTQFADLEKAIELLEVTPGATALVSTREVHPSSFYVQEDGKFLEAIGRRIQEKGVLRRQDEKKEVTPSGNFYFSKMNDFLQDRSFYRTTTLNYIVEDPYGLEVDRSIDLAWAQFLIDQKHIDLKKVIGE